MKKFQFIGLVLLFCSSGLFAQEWSEPKINEGDPALPVWVQLMYKTNPNVFSVDSAYQAFYRTHPFEKTSYTQYYKRWRRNVDPFVNDKGFIVYPSVKDYQSREANAKLLKAKEQQRTTAANWISKGPYRTYALKQDDAAQPPVSWQANTYSIDRSLSNPDILFCGTEAAGLYKSTDRGLNWQLVSSSYLITSARCVRIHPTNPDIVFAGSRGQLFKSIDGGITWNATGDATFQSYNLQALEMAFQPGNPSVILLATSKGLFRSTDAGDNWVRIFNNESRSVVFKPGDANTVYATQYNPATKIADFYKSVDAGVTFAIKSTGWFSVPAGSTGLIESKGGELAVTEANPNKIYALLVGSSQSGASLQLNGFIGIYVSNDAGETWTNPHGQVGAPYSGSHPNLMNFNGDNGTYNQIYYNTTMVASQINENRILIGGLSMWRSDNGAASYTSVGGYVGTVKWIHPDQQELRVYKTSAATEEIWCANDGGINLSPDFYATHESRTNGVTAVDFWGFDIGWDEEVLVGGRYHNGNTVMRDTYPDKKSLRLGGGEAPTGYVNPGENSKTYFSDIGGRNTAPVLDGTVTSFSVSHFPNESYYVNNSSRMVFDPRSWNTVFLGKDNILYKSTDGGSSFKEQYVFGGTANDKVYWIEMYKPAPMIMYVFQRVGNGGALFKSTDGGQSFSEISIPYNSYYEVSFTVSATNPNELWVAYLKTPNGQKVFKTTDAGSNWQNITGALLNGISVRGIAHQEGTDGGVYIGCNNGQVFYRNNTHADWQPFSSGLPVAFNTLRIVPFYRKNKLLVAGNFGVWETDLFERSANKAQISADKLYTECPGDTVWFKDHSVSDDAALTYQWSFPGGNPATSTERNPKIAYAASGNYSVSLTITGATGAHTQTLTDLITVGSLCDNIVDTIAGAAINLPDNSSYTSLKPLNITTNTITFVTWMKPVAHDHFAGVIFTRGGTGTACGINMINGNKLAFHFGDQGWGHTDGPVLPMNEWSHVALVINGTSATYFVNGVQQVQWNDLTGNSVNFFNNIVLGRDPSYTNRNYKGNLDEVSIWNKALTVEEIREMMHQTLKGTETGLKFYVQFNEPHNVFYVEKISGQRGYPVGNAGHVPSLIATGTGAVKTNTEVNGLVSFAPANASVQYITNGAAKTVVSRIFNQPSVVSGISAADALLTKQYWVMNRFEATSSYTGNLLFTVQDDISAADAANPSGFKLYRRNFNSETNWLLVGTASAVDAGTKQITFPSVSVQGQFVITKPAIPTDVREIDTDNQLLIYPNPVLTTAVITGKDYFNNSRWQVFNSKGQLTAFGIIRDGSKQFSINLEGLSNGLYLLHVMQNGKPVLTKRLMKL